jgi:hypothetical protein
VATVAAAQVNLIQDKADRSSSPVVETARRSVVVVYRYAQILALGRNSTEFVTFMSRTQGAGKIGILPAALLKWFE